MDACSASYIFDANILTLNVLPSMAVYAGENEFCQKCKNLIESGEKVWNSNRGMIIKNKEIIKKTNPVLWKKLCFILLNLTFLRDTKTL